MRLGNHLRLGPVVIRIGSKNLASWGFPRLSIGGLSFWSYCNTGELMLASYHPRSSITWLWSITLTRGSRGYAPLWSRVERERLAKLYADGNPFVGPSRWFHVFWQPDHRRLSQWHDHLRLPFGWSLRIGRQKRMPWKEAA